VASRWSRGTETTAHAHYCEHEDEDDYQHGDERAVVVVVVRAPSSLSSPLFPYGRIRSIVVLAPSLTQAEAAFMPRNVALLCFPDGQSLDVTGPYEVFSAATRLAGAGNGYALTLLSPDGQPARNESGITFMPDGALAAYRVGRKGLDTLMVCGGLGARRAASDADVQREVRRLARKARRVTSVCTGAYVLAGSGLLDGKRATTHWARCAQLARRYPKVRVEAAPIYVRDGATWTSAGVSAGIDLALALVAEDLGQALASEVARYLVVFVRRAGGQAQFSAQLSAQSAESLPLRELMAFILEHPDETLDVPSMAARVGMSVRHFSRSFHTQTGSSPAAYVERVRVETARRLLEQSARNVEEVASAAGFGTGAALRRAFARRVALNPREYRARFGTH
jgi:transcriptional regulator GlxA family with amidase domain